MFNPACGHMTINDRTDYARGRVGDASAMQEKVVPLRRLEHLTPSLRNLGKNRAGSQAGYEFLTISAAHAIADPTPSQSLLMW